MNVYADHAPALAAMGWHSMPCWPKGKTPIVPKGSHEATIDPETIARWSRRYMNANVAIVAGPSRLLILDRDPRNGGTETLRTLVDELGPLPQTVASITGSGGGHALFRAVDGDLVGHLGPGLDVISGYRYIIAPPSIHPSGNRYQWREGRAPGDLEVAELPPAWLARIVRPAPKVSPSRPHVGENLDPDRVLRRARNYLAKLPPAISGQRGHDTTYQAALVAVRGFGLPEHHALDLMREYNARCSPPWRERDLARKVREAAKSARVPFGYLLDGVR